MAFHLSRETGKIIRIVSRGSQSFANILRFALFNIVPTFLEIIFTVTVISILYPGEFALLTGSVVFIYVLATVCITEWRAKSFKSQAQKDTEYV